MLCIHVDLKQRKRQVVVPKGAPKHRVDLIPKKPVFGLVGSGRAYTLEYV